MTPISPTDSTVTRSRDSHAAPALGRARLDHVTEAVIAAYINDIAPGRRHSGAGRCSGPSLACEAVSR